MPALPEFVAPMLAQTGQPFDSDDFLFEIKWDGTRALIYVDNAESYRIINRHRNGKTAQYPELAEVARQLPPGTILDGEIIVLGETGKPDFSLMQTRERPVAASRIKHAARTYPATFVAFDVIYRDYESVMHEPLSNRREMLLEVYQSVDNAHSVASDGVIGQGREYFEQVVRQELEGVVAKRLDSRYLEGRRTEAWIKIKKQQHLMCVIIGYIPDANDIECLLVAANMEDGFRFVGRVGSGMTNRQRDELLAWFAKSRVDEPLVACPEKKGIWVEPSRFCEVRFLELSKHGEMRDPVVEQFVD